MSEKPTSEEIARAVLACSMEMSVQEAVYQAQNYFGGCFDRYPPDYRPERITFVRRHDSPEGQRLHIVDVAQLVDALNGMEFRRPTEDEAVRDLERPAQHLRDELLGAIVSPAADAVLERKIALLDAYLAGLRLRVPESLRDELERARERVEKEADPDWKTYERLHEKFGGERP